jgi:hypothetical protein
MVVFEIMFETLPQLIIQGANNSCLGQWSFVAAVSYAASMLALCSELVVMFIETRMKNHDRVVPVNE